MAQDFGIIISPPGSSVTDRTSGQFTLNTSNPFIKIDTQGSEMDIFNGGQRVMHAARFIQLELSLIEYNQGAPLMNTMMRYMYANGFRLSAHVEDHVMNGELIQQDFIFYNSRWQK